MQPRRYAATPILPLWEEDTDFRFKTPHGIIPTLRIVLKTKNEPLLLQKWISHHASIVGVGNLVILDNMSDDAEVINIYRKYQSSLQVIQFTEFYDHIHDRYRFPALHAALQRGSAYYTIIDTDEFLYFYGEGRFDAGPNLLDRLASLDPPRSVPTVWLHTAAGYERRPICAGKQSIVEGLTWGKTIFRSATCLDGLVSHNCQVPLAEFSRGAPVAGFFLFHLTMLSPKQRIRANRAKLVAAGLADPSDSLEAILQKYPDSTNMYVFQIRQLVGAAEPETCEQDPIRSGTIKVLADGAAVFASKLEEASFNSFVADFSAICEETFTMAGANGSRPMSGTMMSVGADQSGITQTLNPF